MSLSDRDSHSLPASFDTDMYDQPEVPEWTDAELREDALRSVAAAKRALDTAADRLCVLVERASDQEADAIEGYARNIDEAREAIRAAKRWGLR